MTTRRRRAGSESYVEELTPPGATPAHHQGAQQQPLPPTTTTQLTFTQPPTTLYPQVVGSVTGGFQWVAPLDQASYYKKTDTASPVPVPVYSGQPQPPLPSQPYLHPQGSSTIYSPNLSYGTDGNQWNASGGVSSSSGEWSVIKGQFNSGIVEQSGDVSSSGGKTLSSNGHRSYGALDTLSEGPLYHSTVEDLDMASRDRTQEFARIVRSQQGNYSNGVLPHQEGKQSRDLRQYKDFMQRSRLIGRNISSTYAKLEKLTHLAKKRSLFDDSHDREIQELTGIIRHDLTSLTKQLGDLHNRSTVTSATGNNAHLKKHSSNLVGSLQSKVAIITQKFKDVLEVRTENLKKQAERREHFTGGVVSGELPPSAMVGHHQGSVLVADELSSSLNSSNPSNGDVAINLGSSGAYHQQLQLMEEQDTYLQSRADTMRTIESTIVELGQMFQQLASMIHQQEESVKRIDANVEDAELNVEAAHTELLKYFKSVSSNRMLMIKVFGIMIVFFVIFVVFMA